MNPPKGKKKALFRALLNWFVYLTAVSAPVKAAYTYISQGHLAWMHVSTSESLISLLLYIFDVTGFTILAFAISGTLLSVLIYLPFWVATEYAIDWRLLKSDGRVVNILRYGVAIVLAIYALAFTFFLTSDMKKDVFDKPKHISDLTFPHWFLIVIGGVLLTGAYLDVFDSVKKLLKETDKAA